MTFAQILASMTKSIWQIELVHKEMRDSHKSAPSKSEDCSHQRAGRSLCSLGSVLFCSVSELQTITSWYLRFLREEEGCAIFWRVPQLQYCEVAIKFRNSEIGLHHLSLDVTGCQYYFKDTTLWGSHQMSRKGERTSVTFVNHRLEVWSQLQLVVAKYQTFEQDCKMRSFIRSSTS